MTEILDMPTIEVVRGRCQSLVRAAEGLQRLVLHRRQWNGRRTLGRFPAEHEAMMESFFEAIDFSKLATGGANALAALTGKTLSAVPDEKGCVHNRVIGAIDAAHEPLLGRVIAALRPYLGALNVRIEEHRMAPGSMKVLACWWGGRAKPGSNEAVSRQPSAVRS